MFLKPLRFSTLAVYTQLLVRRYLSTRIIPLIAVAAVGLCVALVVIVVSVMSGFLDNLRASGRTLMGDVVISYPCLLYTSPSPRDS